MPKRRVLSTSSNCADTVIRLASGCNLKSYLFKAVIEGDEHEHGRPAFRAYCPALESIGASTWGESQEEAMNNIQEVLHTIVDELSGEGKEVPRAALIASTESPAVLVTV
jgi:predicted RNase H-like HicB family nuclease